MDGVQHYTGVNPRMGLCENVLDESIFLDINNIFTSIEVEGNKLSEAQELFLKSKLAWIYEKDNKNKKITILFIYSSLLNQ